MCLASVHDVHHRVQWAAIHAEGDGECRGHSGLALQLGLCVFCSDGPSDRLHRHDTAQGLVYVDHAVCADSVLVHEPAQVDEQPMRVGLLVSGAVHGHPMHEIPDPAQAGRNVEAQIVEPYERQVSDRRTQAQDVGHNRDVLRRSREACRRQHALRAKRYGSGLAALPSLGSVVVNVDLTQDDDGSLAGAYSGNTAAQFQHGGFALASKGGPCAKIRIKASNGIWSTHALWANPGASKLMFGDIHVNVRHVP